MKSIMSIYYSFFLLFVSLLITDNDAHAADTLQPEIKNRYRKSINTNVEFGKVLKTHDFVKGDNPSNMPYNNYMAFSLEYGIETDGRKIYQQVWGYPTWGFGFYKMFILNDDQLGHPFALYTFLDAPFKRWEKWSLNYKIGFGLSYNWKRHQVNENNFKYPIGSKMTVYFDLGFLGNVHLTKNLDMSVEFVLTHFSNGSIQMPNYGLNFAAASLGIKYIFNERPEFLTQELPKYNKEWEIALLFSPSIKQLYFGYYTGDGQKFKTFNYSIYTFSAGISRQISYKSVVGAGFDFSWNESYAADTLMMNGIPEKAPYNASDKILIGVYPSFALVINQVTLLLQPGFYIYKKNIENAEIPTTYQRIGIKYTFKWNVFTGVNIRAYNFYKADFIEWNVGYSIRWNKKK